MYSLVLQACLLACVQLVQSSRGKVVLTKHGYIVGLEDTITYKNHERTIYKFLGVPYAEKPIGNLRFKRPQPLKMAGVVYNATYFRPVCIQHLSFYNASIKLAWPGFTNEKGSNEDCLYVNIYTPERILAKRYPVIVYIHGGSFVAGTPVRDESPGDFMPTEDVVLVTVQYRLGIFGFFSTGTLDAPGNVGLLDQVEALKWVQENIESFGGDPNSVTLLGESAGGASVTFHYLTPLSKGLFHRAIAISGVDFSPFAIKPKETVLEMSAQIARNVNCYDEEPSAMLQCLRSVPVDDFLEINGGIPVFLTPFVDNYFLPNHPKKMREQGLFQKLPLMTGFVSHEGSFILKGNEPKYNKQGLRKYLERFAKEQYGAVSSFAVDALEFQYTPWTDLNDAAKFRKKLVEMLSDFFIAAPTHDLLTVHSDNGPPTYLFEFTHRSKLKIRHPKWMGVVHGDTTAYKFGAPLLNKTMLVKFDDDDKNVSDILVHLCLNFAKFGNPTPSRVRGIQWDAYNSSTKAYLKINNNPSMANHFHPARMAFWNHYFPRLVKRKAATDYPGILGSRNDDDSLKINVGALLCLLFVSCMVVV